MMMMPRCPVLSAINVLEITTRNDKKYGGAERPCASIAVYPISVRTVGKKTGSDENETLHEKYIIAVK
jgi:hypothetical protein